MKIAFIWYWDKASQICDNWRDGLRAALEEIENQGHQVSWYLDKTLPDPDEKFDFVLFWDDSNSEFFNYIDTFDCPKGICLTTDPHNFDNLRRLNVVYCESTPVYNAVRSQGIKAIKAFGTDTNFFKPGNYWERDIKYFYPATFSPWKRQSEIAYLGSDLLCIGTLQPDGVEELNVCIDKGVQVKMGYFPAEEILNYYQRTQAMIIPAVHGSERTVLEAMSCDILPRVTCEFNTKTQSYIQEFENSGLDSPQEFVLKNYSHEIYAQQLLKGMKHD